MTRLSFALFLIGLLSSMSPAHAAYDLEFDAKRNKVELIGPYIKFNFLKLPFSFGSNRFKKSDVRLEVMPGFESGSTIVAVWPQYFLSNGSISFFNHKNKVLTSSKFTSNDINTMKGLHTLAMSFDVEKFRSEYDKGIHFCVRDDLPTSSVVVCSDKLVLKSGKFSPLKDSLDVKALLNKRKVPTNAQINLDTAGKNFHLQIKFRSGLKISITDRIEVIPIEQVYLNIKERKVGVSSRRKKFHTANLTISQKIKKYLKEKNYYREKLSEDIEWPQQLTDVEMEFAPFEEAASLQMYGLSFNEIPSKDFDLQLDARAPIATYRDTIILKGYKVPNENVYATKEGALRVSKDKTKFLWTFSTPSKGTFNRDHLAYSRDKGEKFFFSRQVYRGHQASISASAAIGSSLDLSLVPGFQVNADYWPETVWNRHPLAFQRWGFAFTKVQTFSKFSVAGSDEKWNTDWINFDIMARFTSGVRPVESTLGLGLRYLNPSFGRELKSTLSPQLIGVGGFWHTAPQKIVDDVFSTVPFFRYPKWMEISVYFYPFTMSSGFTLGLAFSYSARGRLYFAQNWFFDASANVNSVTFSKKGDVKATVATAQGTLGIGYNF